MKETQAKQQQNGMQLVATLNGQHSAVNGSAAAQNKKCACSAKGRKAILIIYLIFLELRISSF